MNDTLDLARRHVIKGREIVARQRERLEWLKAARLNTRDAEQTLVLFEQSLAIFEDHLKD